MKVLITAMGHFCDRPTGSARVAFDEAMELTHSGEDVWVLAPGMPSLPEHEVRDGIHLLRYIPARLRRGVRTGAPVTRRQLPPYLPGIYPAWMGSMDMFR